MFHSQSFQLAYQFLVCSSHIVIMTFPDLNVVHKLYGPLFCFYLLFEDRKSQFLLTLFIHFHCIKTWLGYFVFQGVQSWFSSLLPYGTEVFFFCFFFDANFLWYLEIIYVKGAFGAGNNVGHPSITSVSWFFVYGLFPSSTDVNLLYRVVKYKGTLT